MRWKKDRVELLVQSSNHWLMGMQRSKLKTKEIRYMHLLNGESCSIGVCFYSELLKEMKIHNKHKKQ